MSINCGDIFSVWFPYTDQTSSKLRPAVVVCSDEWHFGEDRVFIPISSQPHADDPLAIFIPDNHPNYAETGLRCASSAKWTKPHTISRKVIARRLGVMPSDLLIEIKSKVSEMLAPKLFDGHARLPG